MLIACIRLTLKGYVLGQICSPALNVGVLLPAHGKPVFGFRKEGLSSRVELGADIRLCARISNEMAGAVVVVVVVEDGTGYSHMFTDHSCPATAACTYVCRMS